MSSAGTRLINCKSSTCSARWCIEPSRLDFDDLDADRIAGFLDRIEAVGHVTASTRKARLAAIHSFFRFAALRHPEHAASIARVLAIAPKRTDDTWSRY